MSNRLEKSLRCQSVQRGATIEESQCSARAREGSKRMPLLPDPFYDEAFGSWLRRCAVAHGFDQISQFVAAVLAREGHLGPLLEVDWDTNPPRRVLEIMAKQLGCATSRLERMIVEPGPRILRPQERDAYCPRCFKEDLKWRAIYQRRVWLDSWAFKCTKHNCLLGRYEGFDRSQPGYEQLELTRDDQVRLGVSTLGRLVTFSFGVRRSCRNWLDLGLLKDDRFRSLLLLAGAIEGDLLRLVTIGTASPVWESDGGEPIAWLKAKHPRAGVATRLQAARVAGIVWPCIREDDFAPSNAGLWLRVLFARMSDWDREAMKLRLTLRGEELQLPGRAYWCRRVPAAHAESPATTFPLTPF